MRSGPWSPRLGSNGPAGKAQCRLASRNRQLTDTAAQYGWPFGQKERRHDSERA